MLHVMATVDKSETGGPTQVVLGTRPPASNDVNSKARHSWLLKETSLIRQATKTEVQLDEWSFFACVTAQVTCRGSGSFVGCDFKNRRQRNRHMYAFVTCM